MLRAGQIQGDGSIVFGVQIKLEPLLLLHVGGRLLLATHLEESNHLPNQKQATVNKYDFTVFITLVMNCLLTIHHHSEKENTSRAPIIYLQSTKHLENRINRNNICKRVQIKLTRNEALQKPWQHVFYIKCLICQLNMSINSPPP